MSRQYTLQRAPLSTSIHIDYATELNEQQLAAVTAPPGPQLIIAGAGSGKTRTLTYRVAYLLENGIDPRNILLLTFTNKAARQMLDRVANLLPIDASGLWGGTFHSVGNRMSRRHGSALGYNSGFTIMDREDQKDLINTVVASVGIDPKEIRFPKGDVLAEIFSFIVNTEKPLEELLAAKFSMCTPAMRKRRRRLTRWISMTCWKKHCRCSSNTKGSRNFIDGNFNSFLSINIKTRTKSRLTSSMRWHWITKTSWSLAMMRNRFTRGAARIFKTF